MNDPHVQAIATAAKQLDDFRNGWLHPTGSMFSGPAAEKILQKRTLTDLYNALNFYRSDFKGKKRSNLRWGESAFVQFITLEETETLDHIHASLDHAVLDAYGWPHNLSEEQILERLLALNLERAK